MWQLLTLFSATFGLPPLPWGPWLGPFWVNFICWGQNLICWGQPKDCVQGPLPYVACVTIVEVSRCHQCLHLSSRFSCPHIINYSSVQKFCKAFKPFKYPHELIYLISYHIILWHQGLGCIAPLGGSTPPMLSRSSPSLTRTGSTISRLNHIYIFAFTIASLSCPKEIIKGCRMKLWSWSAFASQFSTMSHTSYLPFFLHMTFGWKFGAHIPHICHIKSS